MPNVELLFGPMLIGVFLNTMLYGVLVVQMFIYVQSSKGKSDSRWTRLFVFYLFFCETLNTCFDIYLIYEPLVQRYDTERALTIVPIMLHADPIVTVIISVPVQLFICWRIRKLNGSNIITFIITFFAICSFVGGVATTISVGFIPEFAQLSRLEGAVITWLASSAIADVIITVALVWSLHKRRTGFAMVDDVLNKIIRLTVQTGLITAIFATLDVVFFLVLPHTSFNFLWDFALSKLYTNSLMSTFNARSSLSASIAGKRQRPDNVLFGSSSQSGTQSSTTKSNPEARYFMGPKTAYSSEVIELQAPTAAMTSSNHSLINKTPNELEAAIPHKRTIEAWESEQRPHIRHEWTGEYTSRF